MNAWMIRVVGGGVALSVLLWWAGGARGAEGKPDTTPKPETAPKPDAQAKPDAWIPVKEVSEEYDYVRAQRCRCGGKIEVVRQATGKSDGRNFDLLVCRCANCGTAYEYTFDVTSIFEEMALAGDEKAEAKVRAHLDRQYPKLEPKHLAELKQLLRHRNPHYRTWAMDALGRLDVPEAREILLDGYLRNPLIVRIHYGLALKKVGEPVVPYVEKRLAGADADARWELISLLGDIGSPKARPALEKQLRAALGTDEQLRRICYIALGQIGDRGSEPLLLEALGREPDPPDDALVWALGCCGAKDSTAAIRKHVESSNERVRLAAIAALGLVGDRESIPRLIELAGDQKDLKTAYNAIYALGKLKAREAVPALIRVLRTPPKYGGFTWAAGIYGDPAHRYTDTNVNVAIEALTAIGDRRALPEFERILRDDRYCLDHEEVAVAAAALGFRELIPAIIDRLAKDYAGNVKLFGKDHERFSPPLRKLTGQKLGEDPEAWRAWQKTQKSSSPFAPRK